MKIDIQKLAEAIYPHEADPFDLTGLADRFEVQGPPIPAAEVAQRRARLVEAYRADPGGIALALAEPLRALLDVAKGVAGL